MAIHSNILACGIPWTEEPGDLSHKESSSIERLTLSLSFPTKIIPDVSAGGPEGVGRQWPGENWAGSPRT